MFFIPVLSFVSPFFLIAPHPTIIHIRSLGATSAWPHTLMGGPASCTSSWPSPLPGLLLSLCSQRLASPAHSPRQKLGSPLLCRKSRAAATSRTTRLASRSLKCFCFWMWVRMEPGEQRGHRGMPFQALLSITSQRPNFYRFGGGDIGLLITKYPAPSVAPGTQEVPAQNWTEKNWTAIFYTCTEERENNYFNNQKYECHWGRFGFWNQKEVKMNQHRVGCLSIGTFSPLHLISDPNKSTSFHTEIPHPHWICKALEKERKKDCFPLWIFLIILLVTRFRSLWD